MNIRIFLCLLAIGFFPIIAYAADAKTGTLTGTVVNENGDLVVNAAVTLQTPPKKNAPQKTIATAVSNEKGEFTFNHIPPAEGYVIAAETKERWGSKDKLNIKAGQTTDAAALKIVKGYRL